MTRRGLLKMLMGLPLLGLAGKRQPDTDEQPTVTSSAVPNGGWGIVPGIPCLLYFNGQIWISEPISDA